MEILSFSHLSSTQLYLIEKIKDGSLKAPIAVICQTQSAGVGSRDNLWIGEEGNFFASIALDVRALPNDLPLESASIYFSYMMKEILLDYDNDIWLKWPNDFYKNDNKVGGTITKKINDVLVCGIGINLNPSKKSFAHVQSDISPQILLEKYLVALEKFPKWKHIFSDFEVDFELSKKFSVHIENNRMSLAQAQLCEDGSLQLAGKKVYSLR